MRVERCHTPRPCAWRDCHLLARPHGQWKRQHHLQLQTSRSSSRFSSFRRWSSRLQVACYPHDAVKGTISKHLL